MPDQIQRAGRDSVNLQASTLVVHQGPSYSEIRDIAQDVFKANFLELSGVAAETVARRAEEISERIVQRLMREHPQGFDGAADPDMQVALYTVQREYARTGDADLAEILVNVLIDRSKQPSRSLLQIVLNEALQAAPKLTREQLATLSVIFILRYNRSLGMTSLDTLRNYIEHRIAPFVSMLTKSLTCYQHLEYVGCGSISMGHVSIPDIFRITYPGLFAAGFTIPQLRQALPELAVADNVLSVSLRDPQLLQLNAIDDETFKRVALAGGMHEEAAASLLSFERNSHMMNNHEIEAWLRELHPVMEPLIDIWDNSQLRNMTLTSVGVAIGHADAQRITGDRDNLATWIH